MMRRRFSFDRGVNFLMISSSSASSGCAVSATADAPWLTDLRFLQLRLWTPNHSLKVFVWPRRERRAVQQPAIFKRGKKLGARIRQVWKNPN
jgi:hypothetical protein